KEAQKEKLESKEKAAQEELPAESEVACETRDVEGIVTRKINFRNKKFYFLLLLGVVCTLVSTYFYCNRPSVKYGGHGFAYMNGFSSTDFKDYMVYSENSKLVALDHETEFMIDKKEDMPILDGAEACYPLYAAFAKAVYKDIDQIELSWKEENKQSYKNGEVVTFTNTILGLERLLFGASEEERQFGDYTDLFFGARPSGEQMQMARDFGVELEVTPIGKEGFVFFVEEDNPIDGLTSEEIKDIYSGKITNWKELGGKDEEIIAFQRPGNSGSQTMMEYFMGDVPLKEAKKYEMVSAMEGVIRQVAQYHNEKGAMGYSFRYFLDELNQEKGVKMLAVDGVYPTLDTIADGTYPLTTSLCVISRKEDPNPNVRKMIDFILSEDGQYMIKETGYAPLN
ncbi:MAG: substrate-binding domain-containing protein, partial [Dorea sp.]|nr:substrate-binding domain-containing protein [Dorea sp.]